MTKDYPDVKNTEQAFWKKIYWQSCYTTREIKLQSFQYIAIVSSTEKDNVGSE